MANKFIAKAAEDSLDIIETYNKGIINWIYSLDDQPNSILAQKFKNQSDMAMLNRLEYGKILIDLLTNKIGKL